MNLSTSILSRKILAVSISVCMGLTQALPYGWSETLLTEATTDDRTGVSVEEFDAKAGQGAIPSGGLGDPTAGFLGNTLRLTSGSNDEDDSAVKNEESQSETSDTQPESEAVSTPSTESVSYKEGEEVRGQIYSEFVTTQDRAPYEKLLVSSAPYKPVEESYYKPIQYSFLQAEDFHWRAPIRRPFVWTITDEEREVLNRVNDPDFDFDFDGDGKLTNADYGWYKSFDGQGGDILPMFLTRSARAKLDLNGDRRITPEDVVLFGERLKQEQVTPFEAVTYDVFEGKVVLSISVKADGSADVRFHNRVFKGSYDPETGILTTEPNSQTDEVLTIQIKQTGEAFSVDTMKIETPEHAYFYQYTDFGRPAMFDLITHYREGDYTHRRDTFDYVEIDGEHFYSMQIYEYWNMSTEREFESYEEVLEVMIGKQQDETNFYFHHWSESYLAYNESGAKTEILTVEGSFRDGELLYKKGSYTPDLHRTRVEVDGVDRSWISSVEDHVLIDANIVALASALEAGTVNLNGDDSLDGTDATIAETAYAVLLGYLSETSDHPLADIADFNDDNKLNEEDLVAILAAINFDPYAPVIVDEIGFDDGRALIEKTLHPDGTETLMLRIEAKDGDEFVLLEEYEIEDFGHVMADDRDYESLSVRFADGTSAELWRDSLNTALVMRSSEEMPVTGQDPITMYRKTQNLVIRSFEDGIQWVKNHEALLWNAGSSEGIRYVRFFQFDDQGNVIRESLRQNTGNVFGSNGDYQLEFVREFEEGEITSYRVKAVQLNGANPIILLETSLKEAEETFLGEDWNHMLSSLKGVTEHGVEVEIQMTHLTMEIIPQPGVAQSVNEMVFSDGRAIVESTFDSDGSETLVLKVQAKTEDGYVDLEAFDIASHETQLFDDGRTILRVRFEDGEQAQFQQSSEDQPLMMHYRKALRAEGLEPITSFTKTRNFEIMTFDGEMTFAQDHEALIWSYASGGHGIQYERFFYYNDLGEIIKEEHRQYAGENHLTLYLDLEDGVVTSYRVRAIIMGTPNPEILFEGPLTDVTEELFEDDRYTLLTRVSGIDENGFAVEISLTHQSMEVSRHPKVEVVAEMAFGDGTVIVEQVSTVDGEVSYAVKVLGADGAVLREDAVQDEGELTHLDRLPAYEEWLLKVTTLDGKEMEFKWAEMMEPPSVTSSLDVFEDVVSAMHGPLQRRTIFRFLPGEAGQVLKQFIVYVGPEGDRPVDGDTALYIWHMDFGGFENVRQTASNGYLRTVLNVGGFNDPEVPEGARNVSVNDKDGNALFSGLLTNVELIYEEGSGILIGVTGLDERGGVVTIHVGKDTLNVSLPPQVIEEIAFGDGSVIIEKTTHPDGTETLKAMVLDPEGQEISVHDIQSYEVTANGLQIVLTDRETAFFSTQTPGVFQVFLMVESAQYGVMKETNTYKFVTGQNGYFFRKTGELLTAEESGRLVQTRYWIYDDAGNLLVEELRQTAQSGQSIFYQQIPGADGETQHHLQFHEPVEGVGTWFAEDVQDVEIEKEEGTGLLRRLSAVKEGVGIEAVITRETNQVIFTPERLHEMDLGDGRAFVEKSLDGEGDVVYHAVIEVPDNTYESGIRVLERFSIETFEYEIHNDTLEYLSMRDGEGRRIVFNNFITDSQQDSYSVGQHVGDLYHLNGYHVVSVEGAYISQRYKLGMSERDESGDYVYRSLQGITWTYDEQGAMTKQTMMVTLDGITFSMQVFYDGNGDQEEVKISIHGNGGASTTRYRGTLHEVDLVYEGEPGNSPLVSLRGLDEEGVLVTITITDTGFTVAEQFLEMPFGDARFVLVRNIAEEGVEYTEGIIQTMDDTGTYYDLMKFVDAELESYNERTQTRVVVMKAKSGIVNVTDAFGYNPPSAFVTVSSGPFEEDHTLDVYILEYNEMRLQSQGAQHWFEEDGFRHSRSVIHEYDEEGRVVKRMSQLVVFDADALGVAVLTVIEMLDENGNVIATTLKYDHDQEAALESFELESAVDEDSGIEYWTGMTAVTEDGRVLQAIFLSDSIVMTEELERRAFGDGEVLVEKVLNPDGSESLRARVLDPEGEQVSIYDIQDFDTDPNGITVTLSDRETARFMTGVHSGRLDVYLMVESSVYGTMKETNIYEFKAAPHGDYFFRKKSEYLNLEGNIKILQSRHWYYDDNGRETHEDLRYQRESGEFVFYQKIYDDNGGFSEHLQVIDPAAQAADLFAEVVENVVMEKEQGTGILTRLTAEKEGVGIEVIITKDETILNIIPERLHEMDLGDGRAFVEKSLDEGGNVVHHAVIEVPDVSSETGYRVLERFPIASFEYKQSTGAPLEYLSMREAEGRWIVFNNFTEDTQEDSYSIGQHVGDLWHTNVYRVIQVADEVVSQRVKLEMSERNEDGTHAYGTPQVIRWEYDEAGNISKEMIRVNKDNIILYAQVYLNADGSQDYVDVSVHHGSGGADSIRFKGELRNVILHPANFPLRSLRGYTEDGVFVTVNITEDGFVIEERLAMMPFGDDYAVIMRTTNEKGDVRTVATIRLPGIFEVVPYQVLAEFEIERFEYKTPDDSEAYLEMYDAEERKIIIRKYNGYTVGEFGTIPQHENRYRLAYVGGEYVSQRYWLQMEYRDDQGQFAKGMPQSFSWEYGDTGELESRRIVVRLDGVVLNALTQFDADGNPVSTEVEVREETLPIGDGQYQGTLTDVEFVYEGEPGNSPLLSFSGRNEEGILVTITLTEAGYVVTEHLHEMSFGSGQLVVEKVTSEDGTVVQTLRFQAPDGDGWRDLQTYEIGGFQHQPGELYDTMRFQPSDSNSEWTEIELLRGNVQHYAQNFDVKVRRDEDPALSYRYELVTATAAILLQLDAQLTERPQQGIYYHYDDLNNVIATDTNRSLGGEHLRFRTDVGSDRHMVNVCGGPCRFQGYLSDVEIVEEGPFDILTEIRGRTEAGEDIVIRLLGDEIEITITPHVIHEMSFGDGRLVIEESFDADGISVKTARIEIEDANGEIMTLREFTGVELEKFYDNQSLRESILVTDQGVVHVTDGYSYGEQAYAQLSVATGPRSEDNTFEIFKLTETKELRLSIEGSSRYVDNGYRHTQSVSYEYDDAGNVTKRQTALAIHDDDSLMQDAIYVIETLDEQGNVVAIAMKYNEEEMPVTDVEYHAVVDDQTGIEYWTGFTVMLDLGLLIEVKHLWDHIEVSEPFEPAIDPDLDGDGEVTLSERLTWIILHGDASAAFDLNGDGFVNGNDARSIRDYSSWSKDAFERVVSRILQAVRENADPYFDENGDGRVDWDEYSAIRAQLVGDRSFDYEDVELVWLTEGVIREHATDPETPMDQREQEARYFDLDGDGFVTVTDELMVRNGDYDQDGLFKLLYAVYRNADSRFDLDGDGKTNWNEFYKIGMALFRAMN